MVDISAEDLLVEDLEYADDDLYEWGITGVAPSPVSVPFTDNNECKLFQHYATWKPTERTTYEPATPTSAELERIDLQLALEMQEKFNLESPPPYVDADAKLAESLQSQLNATPSRLNTALDEELALSLYKEEHGELTGTNEKAVSDETVAPPLPVTKPPYRRYNTRKPQPNTEEDERLARKLMEEEQRQLSEELIRQLQQDERRERPPRNRQTSPPPFIPVQNSSLPPSLQPFYQPTPNQPTNNLPTPFLPLYAPPTNRTSVLSSTRRGRGGYRYTHRAQQDDIDVDNMSYEQLLELEEKIGNVKSHGATKEQLQALPVTVLKSVSSQNPSCTICMDDFQVGDKVKTLPCFHPYHVKCIDNWLEKKKNCPICQVEITS